MLAKCTADSIKLGIDNRIHPNVQKCGVGAIISVA